MSFPVALCLPFVSCFLSYHNTTPLAQLVARWIVDLCIMVLNPIVTRVYGMFHPIVLFLWAGMPEPYVGGVISAKTNY